MALQLRAPEAAAACCNTTHSTRGWEGTGELVVVITGESKGVLEELGTHRRATTASLLRPCLLLLIPGCAKIRPRSAHISVPAITMTTAIRDSYHSARHRFEAEPLSRSPPPPRGCGHARQLFESQAKGRRFRSVRGWRGTKKWRCKKNWRGTESAHKFH